MKDYLCVLVCVFPPNTVFVQVGHYKAAMLTCSTQFTSAIRENIPTAQGVCICVCVFVLVCLCLHLCVCVICVCKCAREVVSVCLDLLVILAQLFRGNQNLKEG